VLQGVVYFYPVVGAILCRRVSGGTVVKPGRSLLVRPHLGGWYLWLLGSAGMFPRTSLHSVWFSIYGHSV